MAAYLFAEFLQARGIVSLHLSQIFLYALAVVLFLLGCTVVIKNTYRVIGGMCLLALVLWVDHVVPDPNPVFVQFLTTQQQLSALPSRFRDSSSAINDDKLPGMSITMIVRLNRVVGGRRNYIFDIGRTEGPRFSGYLIGHTFVISVTDPQGAEFSQVCTT